MDDCQNLQFIILLLMCFNWFYRPSSLDALVFGALAPLLKVPFPVVILRNHFKGCSNLWSLCQRILDKYFPLSPEGMWTNYPLKYIPWAIRPPVCYPNASTYVNNFNPQSSGLVCVVILINTSIKLFMLLYVYFYINNI